LPYPQLICIWFTMSQIHRFFFCTYMKGLFRTLELWLCSFCLRFFFVLFCSFNGWLILIFLVLLLYKAYLWWQVRRVPSLQFIFKKFIIFIPVYNHILSFWSKLKFLFVSDLRSIMVPGITIGSKLPLIEDINAWMM
jgi:hypothetical protein